MKWEKVGRIFKSNGQFPWMMSHAQVPIAEHIADDAYRIYFSTRDAENKTHISWLEIDITRPNKIETLAPSPLISPGKTGAFDDSGAMTSWLLTHEDMRHFFYIGWNIRTTVPFHTSIGLATGPASTTPPEITHRPTGPVLERGPAIPYFCSNPCVLIENGIWRMWFLSGRGWEKHDNKFVAPYNIQYAESHDGITWQPKTGSCLDFQHQDEIAIARPCVVRTGDKYRMWYCYRGRSYSYRMGYAESIDGLTWNRMDEQVGINLSSSGWDSEMLAYPFVFCHKDTWYMLYCGNGFSKEGFGLAVLNDGDL